MQFKMKLLSTMQTVSDRCRPIWQG